MGPFWSLNDGMYNKHFTIVSYNLQQHRITIKAFHWSTFLGKCTLLVSKFQCTNVTGEIHEIYSTLELCQSVMVDVKFGRRQIENRLSTKTRKKICQIWPPSQHCGFVCAQYPVAPGSNPKHTIYAFSIYIIENVMRKGRK